MTTTVQVLLDQPPFNELAASREVTSEQLSAFFEAVAAPMPTWSEGEARFFEQFAGMSAPVQEAMQAAPGGERVELTQVHVQTRTWLWQSSWSAEEAQEHLGKSHSTLSRWHSAGRIYAFPTRGGRRYPVWQFVVDSAGRWEPLPDLELVVEAIPEGVSPLAIEALMTRPQPFLDGSIPVELMARQGGGEKVAELIHDEWAGAR